MAAALMNCSLCNLGVLCVSVVVSSSTNHRDTENRGYTEILRDDRELGCVIVGTRCIECRCPLDVDSVSRMRAIIYRIS
jgi:hypothetical protein